MTSVNEQVLDSIVRPNRVWSRSEILSRPCPVPQEPGVYGWYFQDIPPRVTAADCVVHEYLTLLYVGISPKKPPKNGAPPSKQNLSKRIRYHMRGNAYGSTLRLTLGCLLSTTLGIDLRRVGSGHRLTFGPGEVVLSRWMEENAFVIWVVAREPWKPEEQLIHSLSLPLNLDHNQDHRFYSQLKAVRASAREKARSLPVLEMP